MKTERHYITGPHHYWMHFWFGIVAGAAIGWWTGAGIFDAGWLVWGTCGVMSLACGFGAGHHGDRFWYWLLDLSWCD
jgi:hypothetical protein